MLKSYLAAVTTELSAQFPAQLHEAPVETMAFRLERKVADLGALRRLATDPLVESAIDLATRQLGEATIMEGAHHPSHLLPDGLLYWTDGERNLAEICRLTELEYGLRDEVYTLGWFQLLARLGLVEL